MKLSIPENILAIRPYTPGKPIEELQRQYGITDVVKLASNENPLGPSPMAIEAIRRALVNIHRYPDGSGYGLAGKLADRLGVSPDNIILGNGSDEIIGMLAHALLRPGDEAILPSPSFLMYEIMVRCTGAEPVCVPLKDLAIDPVAMAQRFSPRTKMVFLTNPNNPSGTVLLKKDFEKFIRFVPEQVVVVVDEAYIEFVRDAHCASGMDFLHQETPIACLRTFSKAYGLAGLRIGYGIMPEELVAILHRVRQPFNVNSLAQAAACSALDDSGFLQKTLRLVHEELDFLYAALKSMGVRYFPTQANFFLIDVARSADEVFEKLLEKGVIVRSMSSYGYPEYIRLSIGLHEENLRFLHAFEGVLKKNVS